jgi:hypothetical protein
MLQVGGTIHLSASDLVGHLNCRHLTNLDLAAANGRLRKPFVRDPLLEILTERGELPTNKPNVHRPKFGRIKATKFSDPLTTAVF